MAVSMGFGGFKAISWSMMDNPLEHVARGIIVFFGGVLAAVIFPLMVWQRFREAGPRHGGRTGVVFDLKAGVHRARSP